MSAKREHWESTYQTKDYKKVGWYEELPRTSLELLSKVNANPSQTVIDVGSGTSVLVDHLILLGFSDITLLDLSQTALSCIEARLGDKGNIPKYLIADITKAIELPNEIDIWHDRAAFHFFTDKNHRKIYMSHLEKNLSSSGHAIIGTFSLNGPDRCSGLNVVQYDEKALSLELPDELELIESKTHVHTMPSGAKQEYMYFIIKKNA